MATFRDRVIDAFRLRFGQPDATTDEVGAILRWKLPRENRLDLHVIIDTPEKQSECHVLVSDPCPWVEEPVRSIRIHVWEEVEPALRDLESQWKLQGCWANPTEMGERQQVHR
jgi:hypothetical protein